ncbi:MAG: hypothetical protein JWM93_2551, partial [Frankiales bacterium]|nr:hypothetical protein [Frankiales bacterium]
MRRLMTLVAVLTFVAAAAVVVLATGRSGPGEATPRVGVGPLAHLDGGQLVIVRSGAGPRPAPDVKPPASSPQADRAARQSAPSATVDTPTSVPPATPAPAPTAPAPGTPPSQVPTAPPTRSTAPPPVQPAPAPAR